MEYDSPNFAEYSYVKKSEGKVRLSRTLMVIFYIAYIVGFFIFATTSKLLPLFAIGPLTLYIIVLCTWRLVKYDIYIELSTGMLSLGRIKVSKNGRRKFPKFSIHVKEALDISEYTDKSQLGDVKRVYDYSESQYSDKRIYIVFLEKGERCAAIFEGTAKLAKLLASLCPNAHDIKGKTFHG